jgi:hypothetical protein
MVLNHPISPVSVAANRSSHFSNLRRAMASRPRLLLVSLLVLLVIGIALWRLESRRQQPAQPTPPVVSSTDSSNAKAADPRKSETKLRAHNLLLRKGPNFRIYVRWLSGRLARTSRHLNPSFDNPDSFDLDIQTGVVRVNIGDIGHFLNSSLADSPLKNVTLAADGPNLKLTGTVHKILPIPVQLLASVSATADNRIRVHIMKINVLRVPVKAFLHVFHVSTADLIKRNTDGLEVEGNDVLLDTRRLLPPPHIRGRLTQVSVESPDIQAVFGDAQEEVGRTELWRNFFSLKGGTVDFGKLTMNSVDLILIDISKDPWFDLDLINYREQFTSGYTRITPDSGLQIFIPDRRDIRAKTVSANDDIEWFKNRSIPPPPQITASMH